MDGSLDGFLDGSLDFENSEPSEPFFYVLLLKKMRDIHLPFDFEVAYYLANNKDIEAAVLANVTTAHDHYLKYGCMENRDYRPIPDPFPAEQYLENNADVLEKAKKEPGVLKRHVYLRYWAYYHWIRYGRHEGRPLSKTDHCGPMEYVDFNVDTVSLPTEDFRHLMQQLNLYDNMLGTVPYHEPFLKIVQEGCEPDDVSFALQKCFQLLTNTYIATLYTTQVKTEIVCVPFDEHNVVTAVQRTNDPNVRIISTVDEAFPLLSLNNIPDELPSRATEDLSSSMTHTDYVGSACYPDRTIQKMTYTYAKYVFVELNPPTKMQTFSVRVDGGTKYANVIVQYIHNHYLLYIRTSDDRYTKIDNNFVAKVPLSEIIDSVNARLILYGPDEYLQDVQRTMAPSPNACFVSTLIHSLAAIPEMLTFARVAGRFIQDSKIKTFKEGDTLFLQNDTNHNIHQHLMGVPLRKSSAPYCFPFPNKIGWLRESLPSMSPFIVERPGSNPLKLEREKEDFYKTDTHSTHLFLRKWYYAVMTSLQLNALSYNLSRTEDSLVNLNKGLGDLSWDTNKGDLVVDLEDFYYGVDGDLESPFPHWKPRPSNGRYKDSTVTFYDTKFLELKELGVDEAMNWNVVGNSIVVFNTHKALNYKSIVIFHTSSFMPLYRIFAKTFYACVFIKTPMNNDEFVRRVLQKWPAEYVIEAMNERFM